MVFTLAFGNLDSSFFDDLSAVTPGQMVFMFDEKGVFREGIGFALRVFVGDPDEPDAEALHVPVK